MLAFEQVGMAGDIGGRYHNQYTARPKQSSSTCRDSVISFSTAQSPRSVRSRPSRPSTASSQTSFASANSEVQDKSKKYRFDTAPKLVKTPWEADRSKRVFSRQWQQELNAPSRPVTATGPKARPLPAHIFKRMPHEVYERLIAQLADIHFETEAGLCLPCYLADLTSLCLVSKAWQPSARRKLYQQIWLPIDDNMHKQTRITLFVRLKQLRRTLRNRPSLGMLVKDIHVPGLLSQFQLLQESDRACTISVLASLVMACPNLEQLTGFHTTFDHEYDRLTHALATRTRLRSKVWILKGIEESYGHHGELQTNARPVQYDGSIENGDVFLQAHATWSRLETLLLFGQDTGNLDYRAFVATFRSLKSLKHLLIAGFDKKQFNDRTVAAVPLDLRSLRLQDLPGVTERGLLRLTGSGNLNSMRELALVNLEISSSRLIARFLATAPRLKRFTLAQSVSPTISSDATPTTIVYASKTLQFLHWDISPFSQPSVGHLARSIQSNAMPALRMLQAPCDDGTLQALCRPRGQIARLTDIDTNSSLTLRSSLAIARMAAQERLEAARQEPLMRVVVTDEDGIVQHKYTIKNFLGNIKSPIHYVLESVHAGRMADDSGIVELETLLDAPELADAGRSSTKLEMCMGPPSEPQTNATEKSVDNKKTEIISKRQQHRARERIRHLDVSKFF